MKTASTVLLLVVLSVQINFAAEYRGEEQVNVSSGDSLLTDLVCGSRLKDISGHIEDDIIAGCQKIHVDGEVGGDILAGCQELIIRGQVRDMVIDFAQDIVIDGEIGGDVIAFGAEVRVTERAHVRGNIYTGSGSFRAEGGRIDGWVRGAAATAFLNGSIGGQVSLEVEDLQFGEKYSAGGGTRLTLSEDLDRDSVRNIPEKLETVIKPRHGFYKSGFFYWSYFAMLVTGIILSSIFKNTTRDLLSHAKTAIMKNTGIGLLVLLGVPFVSVVLLLLVVSIPAALMVLALFVMLVYISGICTGLIIGDRLLDALQGKEKGHSIIIELVIGLLAMVLLTKLPYIGGLICILFAAYGCGCIVTYLWSCRDVKTEQV